MYGNGRHTSMYSVAIEIVVTIQGFKVLIEREWLGYGHKFGDRCGLTTDDSSQTSPIFLQWLDCVHQLTRQYPCDFEFNDNFLVSKNVFLY